MTYGIAWIATAITFGLADFLWLSQAAPRLYRPLIGDILLDGVRLWPALAFYLIYVSGIVYFAVLPALAQQSLTRAAVAGALLGLVAYATYDLSNHATLKVWDWRMTVIDMAWGAFASALAAGVGYAAASRFS
jgi:uncharacterized membrane protein